MLLEFSLKIIYTDWKWMQWKKTILVDIRMDDSFFQQLHRTTHITAWSFVMYVTVNLWHTWQMKLAKIKIIIGNLNTKLKILHLLYKWISSRIIRQHFYLYYDAQLDVNAIRWKLYLLVINISTFLKFEVFIYMYVSLSLCSQI